MPPRGRRKRTSDAGPSSEDPSEVSSAFTEYDLPFFNTTFSTHRVSPLYVGEKPLDQHRFAALAKQLRDLLVGDVVRGVEVGLDGGGSVMARAGALEAVDLGWSSLGSILDIRPEMMHDTVGVDGRPVSRDLGSGFWRAPLSPSDDGSADRQLSSASGRQALHISIRYESALCTALLVPQLEAEHGRRLGDEPTGDVPGADMFQQVPPTDIHSDKAVDPNHFRNLPLLLLRMPTPLRSVIVDFLSSTFDCRISPLRLGTQTLLTNLERWITVSKLMRGSAASRDVVITLGFALPVPLPSDPGTAEPRTGDLGLKSVDVIISPSDLHRFRDEGTKLQEPNAALVSEHKFPLGELAAKRRKVEGGMLEEGWGWRHKVSAGTESSAGKMASHAFTEALGRYLDEHLALNLFDPRTRITKVACGGFVMSESRLKLFSASDKGLGGVPEYPTSITHTRAVIDCLGDLLGRTAARL